MKKTLKRRPGGGPVHQCPHPLWSSHYILSLLSFRAGDHPDYFFRLCPDCTAEILNHLEEVCPHAKTKQPDLDMVPGTGATPSL